MIKKTMLTLLIMLLSINIFCQPINDSTSINFGFEKTTPDQTLPNNWVQWGSDYTLSIDTIIKHKGKNSILIQCTSNKTSTSYGSVVYKIPADFEGKKIELSSYFKTKDIKNGKIGLILRIDDEYGFLTYSKIPEKEIKGTSDWEKYSVKLSYPGNAKTIYIGAISTATGQLWVDDFKLLIDGRELHKAKHKKNTALEGAETLNKISNFKITKEKITEFKTLAMIWGFLKYYHPKVAKGNFDWDQELIAKIHQISTANSKEEINSIYINWINGLGEIKARKCNNNLENSLKYNLNLEWLNDTTLFNKELISRLNFIKANRSKYQYYVKKTFNAPSFSNEKPYKDFRYPAEEYRLLGLFRYWNAINYFFPYKYLIGENWENALTEMIPVFLYAKDITAYNVAIMELCAKIKDSHAMFFSNYSYRYFGYKYPPFQVKIIDNKAVITNFLNDSLCELNDLQIGDAILKIDNKDISTIISEKAKYMGVSNESTLLRNIQIIILKGDSDSVPIIFERNTIVETKYLKRYSSFPVKHLEQIVCKELNDNIGYVNMGKLTLKQVDSVMKIMMHKKGIIFDIRNYPKRTALRITKYLNKEVKAFVKLTKQDLSYPGVYKWDHTYYCGKKKFLLSWSPTYSKGVKNNNYYKGKVVLLFNEETQSHAEFSCMALQTAFDVKCIGSQTAGADGNCSKIMFPGGYEATFTGLGVYYPDGSETQRIGIIPDIKIIPTIDGIRNNKDEILERAIKYINTGY